jgi:hypothetical protein
MEQTTTATKKWFSSLLSHHNLKLIQAASGSAFGTFAVLHLGNIFAAHFDEPTFNEIERILRYYYQNPVIEPLLIIGSLGVHVISSYALVYHRIKKPKELKSPVPLSERLHRWAGYVLTATVPLHILGTRLPVFLFGKEYASDFSAVSYSLVISPFLAYPYLFLLGTAGLYHVVFGGLKAIDRFFGTAAAKKTTGSKLFLPTIGALSVAVLSSLLAFGGVYFPITLQSFGRWYNYLNEVSRRLAIRILPLFTKRCKHIGPRKAPSEYRR